MTMNLWLRSFLIMALMLIASGLSLVLRPSQKIAEQGPAIDLKTMIPHTFADWREEPNSLTQVVDPQQKELLDRIYNQTLSRTYINSQGYRVMLSIAYGSDQRDALQLHKPEVCYPAQGFELLKKEVGTLVAGAGAIPVTRISTRLGQRREPVTYWTTVGDRVVQGGLQKKLAEMSYGLSGKIPDGMLIRVSSIDTDDANAFRVQKAFAGDLLAAVAPQYRQRLGGHAE